jgi:predicted unusual protein kinase regulating ubiquinone biosynthesis (AarF/ABC1/UbiB family)
MLAEVKSTVRAAKRLGETSFAMNKLALRWLQRKDDDKFAYMLRDTMQNLGSTYIKLGQLVASSPTIFPDEYVNAFQTCLDQTPPLAYDDLLPILEDQLGIKLKTRFKHINRTPLASASIAQVHAATLISGEDVVIKIQKPNVKQLLETDFHFLQFATQMMEMINPKAWKTSIKDIVEEIRNGMLEECNFHQELRNIEEFQAFLDKMQIEHVVVPRVYHELSSEKVLVMERFYGVPLSDIDGVRKITPEPEFALVQALDTWFMSLRKCQIYHADLHAGNVMMLNNGKIGFIDFGIVGRLSEQTWDGITSLAVCVPAQDFEGLALALSKIGATKNKEQLDLKRFAKDLELLWKNISNDKMLESQDPDTFWRAITMDFSAIGARHGIRFPREFTLLVKQFLYFDRYIRLLAPTVDMFDAERMDFMSTDFE